LIGSDSPFAIWAMRLGVAANLDNFGRHIIDPHPLKPVKVTNFRTEDMNDHIIGIKQNPIGLSQTFKAKNIDLFLL